MWYNKLEVRSVEKQYNFTDIEYGKRRRTTKREAFLEKMDAIIPWNAWVSEVIPYYPNGSRGRRPREIEQMLRMLLLQAWFNLSDEGVEDTIYDSYAMKTFMQIDFISGEQVPDATTLCKFRKLLTTHGLQKKFFDQVQKLLEREGKLVTGGTIVDATIVEAPSSTKNKTKSKDPDMHSTRKNTKWYFGMRVHVGVDPLYGFVHNVVTTPANAAENKVAATKLLRESDEVVYGDAAYLKMFRYVEDNVPRQYRINIQRGTFKRHHGDGLAWEMEKELENRKSSMRCKVEYVFHVAKDIFGWRKTRYKGHTKNESYAQLLFACVNLYKLVLIKKCV